MTKAIVITHGLFMKKEIMFFLDNKFKELGYKTYSFGYKTRTFSKKTVSEFKEFVDKIEDEEIFFVGHSLGGLLIRHYFETYKPKFKNTCIVTLGTPHNGSSLAKNIENYGFSGIIGETTSSLVIGLGEWNSDLADLGCIAGTKNVGINNIFNRNSLAGDGTVLINEAIASKAKDIAYIKLNHTFLIYSKAVVILIDNFIKHRKFN